MLIKKIFFNIIKLSGFSYLFRELIQKNKVTILLFHDIHKETADKAFNYLSKKYNIIDLNQFIEAIEKKDKSKIPTKALIITFDDGHIENYKLLPVIKKYNIPISLFLCASIINTNRHFWFKFDHPSIHINELRSKSNIDRLHIMNKIGFDQEKEYRFTQALTKQQIMEMKEYINIQSHTLFHPCLPKCNDEEAKIEIVNSKKMLEKEYQLTVNSIAYPYGDYSDRDIHLSKQAGYKCGITVDYGFNTINTNAFRLKRLDLYDTNNMNELIIRASGSLGFLKRMIGKKR